jgi:hypothetical protein
MNVIIQEYSSTPDFIKQVGLIVLLTVIVVFLLGEKE